MSILREIRIATNIVKKGIEISEENKRRDEEICAINGRCRNCNANMVDSLFGGKYYFPFICAQCGKIGCGKCFLHYPNDNNIMYSLTITSENENEEIYYFCSKRCAGKFLYKYRHVFSNINIDDYLIGFFNKYKKIHDDKMKKMREKYFSLDNSTQKILINTAMNNLEEIAGIIAIDYINLNTKDKDIDIILSLTEDINRLRKFVFEKENFSVHEILSLLTIAYERNLIKEIKSDIIDNGEIPIKEVIESFLSQTPPDILEMDINLPFKAFLIDVLYRASKNKYSLDNKNDFLTMYKPIEKKIIKTRMLEIIADKKDNRVPISNKLKHEIWRRDDFTCQYCGRGINEVELEIDHILPVSKGGTIAPSNLQTLCFECNRKKSDN